MTTYETDGQGKFIPASQRPDGSWRKPRRVRDGYVPQEEVPLYESKGKAIAQRLTANNNGLPVGMCPQVAQQERAKRDKAKQQQQAKAKAANTPGLLVLNDSKKVATKSKTTAEVTKLRPTNTAAAMVELANGVADLQVDVDKKLKKLKKKLREIDTIEEKIRSGELKNPEKDQLDKVSRRSQIVKEISQLEARQN